MHFLSTQPLCAIAVSMSIYTDHLIDSVSKPVHAKRVSLQVLSGSRILGTVKIM